MSQLHLLNVCLPLEDPGSLFEIIINDDRYEKITKQPSYLQRETLKL